MHVGLRLLWRAAKDWVYHPDSVALVALVVDQASFWTFFLRWAGSVADVSSPTHQYIHSVSGFLNNVTSSPTGSTSAAAPVSAAQPQAPPPPPGAGGSGAASQFRLSGRSGPVTSCLPAEPVSPEPIAELRRDVFHAAQAHVDRICAECGGPD